MSEMDISGLLNSLSGVKAELKRQSIVGHERLIELLLIALVARGHVLVEGPPGTAKTLTAKLLAHMLARTFRRIQFTSDLLPGDILGSHIYSPATQKFEFIAGPIFADIVLADEINRAPPRTQSALLEAMEERQVTLDGRRMPLSEQFFVVATQNPRDHEGTFPLPEVQLDRFLFKVSVNHSDEIVDGKIIRLSLDGQLPPNFDDIRPLDFPILTAQKVLRSIRFDDSIVSYVAKILAATRSHPMISAGSSVRGGLALSYAARVHALLAGRDFVIPDDIKNLAVPTLAHRLRLTPEAQISQITDSDLIEEILKEIPFPAKST